MWGSAERKNERILADAGQFLAGWQVDASAGGDLLIRPLRPILCYDEMHDVVERLLTLDSIKNSTIVFDMSAVQAVSSQWTAVFALLIRLARFVRGCRLDSLNPPLAAMASMVVRGDQAKPGEGVWLRKSA